MEESKPKPKSENSETETSHQPVDDNQAIELRKSSNPYLIKSKLNMQLDQIEELIRQIRFILNKLTPTNMQKLVNELLNLPIADEKSLKRMADVIYTKVKSTQMPLVS